MGEQKISSLSLEIAPSILSGHFAELGSEITRLNATQCKVIHLDVMDAHFVPNLSFGAPMVKALRPYTQKIFDVHLMMSEPERYLDNFIDAGSDIISIHMEIKGDVKSALRHIRSAGKRASLAVNPDTPLDQLETYLPDLDQILLMSVFPGFGGQKFIRETLDRGREVRRLLAASDKVLDLEIDGGVDDGNIAEIIQAGFNMAVAGNYVFSAKDLSIPIDKLYALARGAHV